MRLVNPFAKTLSGTLTCSPCGSSDVEFVEDTGPGEKRYRCRKCGHYMRYQYRFKPQADDNKPYVNFKRGLNFDFFRRKNK